MKNLHIIFCSDRICIAKYDGNDWQTLQSRFPDYKASVGPWSKEEVMKYWSLDYGDDPAKWPFKPEAVETFVKSGDEVLVNDDKRMRG